MDLIFFAGPIYLKQSFFRIDWLGRETTIVPIQGEGSAHFSALADSLRAADGSILNGMLRRYASHVPVGALGRLAVCAYSAGHGLVSKLTTIPDDRARVDAIVLSDASYDALGTISPKAGYLAYALEAADGRHRMVSTTSNATSGTYLSARDSWGLVMEAVEAFRGPAHRIPSPPPVPTASGGWWQRGELYWGDYALPNAPLNSGNDYSHAEHHDIAPLVWQGLLAPWLARRSLAPFLAAGAAVGGLAWLGLSALGAAGYKLGSARG